jgi:low temperature requirement protein LtrA
MEIIKNEHQSRDKKEVSLLEVFYDLIFAFAVLKLTVLLGAFLLRMMRRGKKFNTEIVDFQNLTERFELLVILTFGEMVIGVAPYFTIDHFNLVSVAAFVIVLLFFGCYVLHNHHLINRGMNTTRGLTLMFSHYAMVISLNMITVGQFFYLRIISVAFS